MLKKSEIFSNGGQVYWIRYEGSLPPQGADASIDRFRVATSDGSTAAVINLKASNTLHATAAGQLSSESPTEQAQMLTRALFRLSIRKIEEALRSGVIPRPDRKEGEVDDILLSSIDSDDLVAVAGDKECDYQAVTGRDIYCTASSQGDHAVLQQTGLSFVAPTTRAICRGCNLPDTDYICTHLSHPDVRMAETMGPPSRGAYGAFCEEGRDEISDPTGCRPGGHDCWTRSVDPVEVPVTDYPPTSLPEVLDFMDTAWRLAVGPKHHLIRLPSVGRAVELAKGAASQSDFESRISALADVFKAMDISDELIGRDTELRRDQTFDRLVEFFSDKLDQPDFGQIKEAVSTLRTINRIRVALQHAGSRRDLPVALAKLGLSYPVVDWTQAWDTIRARAIAALTSIREVTLRVADKRAM